MKPCTPHRLGPDALCIYCGDSAPGSPQATVEEARAALELRLSRLAEMIDRANRQLDGMPRAEMMLSRTTIIAALTLNLFEMPQKQVALAAAYLLWQRAYDSMPEDDISVDSLL